ncbi:MAG TPA: zinc-dependent peptidase [Planctomycetota bacterium]|nr:MAG: Protein MtfA [Planctomycetes bacterium ADurb.Bin069]HNR98409.1 zinc-dependent peptidase [Planctomycetota bacterium]HNU25171.1 zinc-dependent peptidase [Planctomycetota bacterium]HOE30159.1 zinc-dependent peptidase [Planctomycetota bacterium]HOE87141.1 zinc-dependent peptidase [Planctomycetota bacterium]
METMSAIALGAGAAAGIALAVLLASAKSRRERRRAALRAAAFPKKWERILAGTTPLYRRIPPELKRELHGHVHVFLAEKKFVGCRGQAIDDEVRLTIAAQACALLLNRPPRYYPTLREIFVHPTSYVRTTRVASDEFGPALGSLLEEEDSFAGESWERGGVVLAWDEVLESGYGDGYNVVLHEFAHQLDQGGEGAHAMERDFADWARVLREEYSRFKKDVRRGKRTALDEYGATDPAEFFAVATEHFFETPGRMRAKHPQLYEALRDYYRLDPAAWD